MQRLPRREHLRARSAKEPVQRLPRREHLRARSAKEPVQRLPRIKHLRARSAKEQSEEGKGRNPSSASRTALAMLLNYTKVQAWQPTTGFSIDHDRAGAKRSMVYGRKHTATGPTAPCIRVVQHIQGPSPVDFFQLHNFTTKQGAESWHSHHYALWHHLRYHKSSFSAFQKPGPRTTFEFIAAAIRNRMGGFLSVERHLQRQPDGAPRGGYLRGNRDELASSLGFSLPIHLTPQTRRRPKK